MPNSTETTHSYILVPNDTLVTSVLLPQAPSWQTLG
jgi:hypothetical protein